MSEQSRIKVSGADEILTAKHRRMSPHHMVAVNKSCSGSNRNLKFPWHPTTQDLLTQQKHNAAILHETDFRGFMQSNANKQSVKLRTNNIWNENKTG